MMICNYSNQDKKMMKLAFQAKNKSRLQELIDFANLSKYKKLGIANCKGVQIFADKLVEILTKEGFEVTALNCKASGLDGKEICQEMEGPCCDPVSQAKFLNEQKTELNINVGLCLGHGLIFAQYSQAPVTTFLVKDFITGHKTIENLI